MKEEPSHRNCVVCNEPVGFEESVEAYLTFPQTGNVVEDGLAYVTAFGFDGDNDTNWWTYLYIARRDEHADIYPLHLKHTKVRMTDPKGESFEGKVTRREKKLMELDADLPTELDGKPIFVREQLAFDLGKDDNWYEINDSQTPWKMEEIG